MGSTTSTAEGEVAQAAGRRGREVTGAGSREAGTDGGDQTVERSDPALLARVAWQGRDLGWEELVELARSLGPDPELREVPDAELEDRVRVQAAQLAAATCRWLMSVGEFVVRGLWADQGARTPAQWLSWAVGLAPSTARDHVRVALQLRELPLLRERFAQGRITYSKVRALTRVAVPQIEPMLLKWADAATAAEIERLVSGFRRAQRGRRIPPEVREGSRQVFSRPAPDGLVDVVIRVLPDEAVEVRSMLERLADLEQGAESDAATNDDGRPQLALVPPDARVDDGGDLCTGATEARPVPTVEGAIAQAPRLRGGQLVDALLHTLAAAVASGPADTTGADRHTMVVHVDTDDLAQPAAATGEAIVVPIEDAHGRTRAMDRRVLRRLACDAGVVLVMRDGDGTPMDIGRRDRRLSAALRRALLARDRSCRFPGCGTSRHLHAHHVQHWADGGPTDLANLVLLCARHHRFVHDHGWRVEPTGTGRFTFAPPDGGPLPAALPLPDASAAGADELLDVSAIQGADRLVPSMWTGRGGADMDLVVAVLDQELRRALPAAVTAA